MRMQRKLLFQPPWAFSTSRTEFRRNTATERGRERERALVNWREQVRCRYRICPGSYGNSIGCHKITITLLGQPTWMDS